LKASSQSDEEKPTMLIRGCTYGLLFLLAFQCAHGQEVPVADPAAVPNPGTAPDPNAVPDPSAAQSTTVPAPPSVSEKWKLFVSETATPMTLVSAVPDATVSQLMRFAPLYGKHFWRKAAFLKRLGANVGDETSQNLFSDFVLASVWHEDTRYVRKGPSHRIWPRIGYAISRVVVTKTDSGAPTFNWARAIGGAMSAALSNAYYPPKSRTAAIGALNWGTNTAGSGLTNLMPEFGPDIGHWMKRHLPFHH
jgi:hypothetical protein